MHLEAFWEPDRVDAHTDRPVEGSRMLCHLAVTIAMPADDMSVIMDGDRIDMTMTLTPEQMARMGEFLTVQAGRAGEYLHRYRYPDMPDGIAPGTYIRIPLDLEGAGR